jgi:hypothetical protein
MAEARKRVTFLCETCSSNLVTLDAWAEWNVEEQDWVLGAAFDYTFCHKCEAETHMVEVELEPEPQA